MLAAMERQDWFKFALSSDVLRNYFGTSSVKINAEAFKDSYPAIMERFGRNQELELDLNIKNPRF